MASLASVHVLKGGVLKDRDSIKRVFESRSLNAPTMNTILEKERAAAAAGKPVADPLSASCDPTFEQPYAYVSDVFEKAVGTEIQASTSLDTFLANLKTTILTKELTTYSPSTYSWKNMNKRDLCNYWKNIWSIREISVFAMLSLFETYLRLKAAAVPSSASAAVLERAAPLDNILFEITGSLNFSSDIDLTFSVSTVPAEGVIAAPTVPLRHIALLVNAFKEFKKDMRLNVYIPHLYGEEHIPLHEWDVEIYTDYIYFTKPPYINVYKFTNTQRRELLVYACLSYLRSSGKTSFIEKGVIQEKVLGNLLTYALQTIHKPTAEFRSIYKAATDLFKAMTANTLKPAEEILKHAAKVDSAESSPFEKFVGLACIKFYEPETYLLPTTVYHVVNIEQKREVLPEPVTTEGDYTLNFGNAIDSFCFLLSAIEQLGYFRHYVEYPTYKINNKLVSTEYTCTSNQKVEKYLARFLRAITYAGFPPSIPLRKDLIRTAAKYNDLRKDPSVRDCMPYISQLNTIRTYPVLKLPTAYKLGNNVRVDVREPRVERPISYNRTYRNAPVATATTTARRRKTRKAKTRRQKRRKN